MHLKFYFVTKLPLDYPQEVELVVWVEPFRFVWLFNPK